MTGTRLFPALIAAALLVLGLSGPSHARTVLLDASEADRIAGLTEAAPRMSWALRPNGAGQFSNDRLMLSRGLSLMIRFPLDRIPQDHRIAHAELILPVQEPKGNQPRVYLWRVIGGWGRGACWSHRRTVPEKVPWTHPGAAAIGRDRAPEPTGTKRLTQRGPVVVNVTEDVALWHRGAADNHGWLLSVEDPGVQVWLASPVWRHQKDWTLRITHEPAAEPSEATEAAEPDHETTREEE